MRRKRNITKSLSKRKNNELPLALIFRHNQYAKTNDLFKSRFRSWSFVGDAAGHLKASNAYYVGMHMHTYVCS